MLAGSAGSLGPGVGLAAGTVDVGNRGSHRTSMGFWSVLYLSLSIFVCNRRLDRLDLQISKRDHSLAFQQSLISAFFPTLDRIAGEQNYKVASEMGVAYTVGKSQVVPEG